MSVRRRGFLAIVVGIMAGLLTLSGTAAASAVGSDALTPHQASVEEPPPGADPGPDPNREPRGNGCTLTQDFLINEVPITRICNQHDECYESSRDRWLCDEIFESKLIEACNLLSPDDPTGVYTYDDPAGFNEPRLVKRRACEGDAHELHRLVRGLGERYYVGTGDPD